MTSQYLRLKVLAPVVLCGLAWSQAAIEPTGTSSSVVSQAPSAGNERVAPNESGDASYVIGPGDIIGVNVWKEPDVSKAVPVRSDGKISLPLAGELQASGTTPKELERAIADRLQSYISDPEVTVIVQEIKSQKFNILG